MRITVPSLSAPTCFCGSKMEIYVDVYSQKLRVKCLYCGFEQYEYLPFDASAITLKAIYDTVHSLME